MLSPVRYLLPALAVLGFARSAAAADVCYRWPFSNPTLSDGWGSTCCGRTNPHRGVDFPQASGTPIPAAADGVIRRVPYSGCLGNVVVVQHADGMFSGYSHMLSASPLAEGTAVKMGDTVGRVGNTGTCSFGAHLHMTMAPTLGGYASGTTVDPIGYMNAHKTCNRTPKGAFDGASCAGISGWAQDPDAPTAAIHVHLSIGGPAGDPKAYGLSVKADISRPDLCGPLGSCAHGFSALLPLGLRDGVERSVFAYAIDSAGGANAGLGEKKIKCDVPAPPTGVVKRRLANADVLKAWKFATVEIAKLDDAVLAALPVGPELSAAPTLITAKGAPEVFVREYTTVRHVPTPATMTAWEFDFATIKTVEPVELADDLRGAPWAATPWLAKGSQDDVFLLDAPPPLWAELVEDNIPMSMAPGSTADVTLKLKNRGSMAWSAVSLAPTPRDVASALCDASWPSCTRAATIGGDVATDGAATVAVRLRAPSAEGTVTACFGLVTGEHWFSEPGANGFADDALCRTIQITNTPEASPTPTPGGESEAGADDDAMVGGCACRSHGRGSLAGGVSFVALAGVLARRRRR